MDAGVPYPPLNPEPYEIPPEIEARIDRSIRVLPLDVLEREVKNFLRCLKRFKPNKRDLLDALATALEPTRYLHLFENPGPAPAAEIEKPNPETIKPTLKKKTTARGQKWRLDPRWDKLTPCAIAVFLVLCLRAIWPKRLESFPWAFGGVGKWSKEKGWELGSLCKITGYKKSMVQYALLQLQGYGMIKKIFRAYEGMGASKFYVFFTPEMSKAFTALSKNRIRKPSGKKRPSRMS